MARKNGYRAPIWGRYSLSAADAVKIHFLDNFQEFHNQSLSRRISYPGEGMMTFAEIKAAIMNLDAKEQRRVVLELIPEIWPQIVGDDSCIKLLRKLVDEESVRRYQEEHLDHI